MILQHGSPSDLSGRSEREIRTYEFLDSLGISFDRTDHPDQRENTSSIRFKTRDLMEKILPALNVTPTIVHLVGTE